MDQVCSRCGLCLEKVELFEDFGPQEQNAVMEGAQHIHLDKEEVVFSPEDPADRIIIIQKGKIKLSAYDEEGKEYIHALKGVNETIGEEYLFSKRNFGLYGICLEKTHLCILTLDLLKENLKKGDFAFKVIELLGRKLYEEREVYRILSIPDAKKRLEHFLFFRSQKLESRDIPLSTETIAASIQLRRETVSRKLQELVQEGTIEREGYKKIRIKNLERLRID
ncbi:MAG: Crp/Fnr family transcriptional regulator [Tissierellia bacterium]|nr:Crp/Fnr family transcriptional regulator [Tissierellia bacterium]